MNECGRCSVRHAGEGGTRSRLCRGVSLLTWIHKEEDFILSGQNEQKHPGRELKALGEWLTNEGVGMLRIAALPTE